VVVRLEEIVPAEAGQDPRGQFEETPMLSFDHLLEKLLHSRGFGIHREINIAE
jgi:hypothetical protein